MHREIKFRGYSHEHGWVHGDLLQYPDGKVYIMEHSDGESLSYEVDPDSVGQCTGMKMIGGGMIYEGDVLHLYPSRRYAVVWLEDRWMLKSLDTGPSFDLIDEANQTRWLGYSYEPRNDKEYYNKSNT